MIKSNNPHLAGGEKRKKGRKEREKETKEEERTNQTKGKYK